MYFSLPIAGSTRLYPVRPTKIVALGLNYRDHVAETAQAGISSTRLELPSEPILFAKTTNCLCAPGDPIVLPAILNSYDFSQCRTDYEAELAFFVSKTVKNIEPEQAFDCIEGFSCFNDVSQRNIQKSDVSGWFRGKSFDSFGPVGPRLVPAHLMGDIQNLSVECRVNGRTVQSGSTHDMIFSIPEILAFISRNMTLYPGDLVITGTPGGVGPITAGDVVEVEIEGIGTLSNPVVQESALFPPRK